MKTKIVFSVLAGILLIGATAAFIPPVRAQIVHLFTVVVSGPVDITDPNLPGYLPEFNSGPISGSGSAQAVDVNAPQAGTFETIYQKGDKFLVFTQGGDVTSLPDGQPATVNGQAGILTTGLTGQYRQDLPDTTGAVDQNNQPVTLQPITIDYTDASQLTWVAGNTRYQLLSNLPVEEMLKIASELVPAK